MRRSVEIQRFIDNYAVGAALSAAKGDEVREMMRKLFADHGLSEMYEEILAGLDQDGQDANNLVSWQAAMHGARHLGVRSQVEQRMRRR